MALVVSAPAARAITAEAHRSLRWFAALAQAALLLAVTAMLLLHLGIGARLDPLTSTVSDYAWQPGGWLLTVGVLAVAAAALSVAVALVRAGLGAPAPVPLLFALGALGLLAAILFPTNAFGAAATTSAVLHRYAAGLFFVSLPLAAFAVLRRLRVPAVAAGRLAVASVVAGLAFLLSHLPLIAPSAPGADLLAVLLPRGLAERGLLAIDLGLLSALATLARRVAR